MADKELVNVDVDLLSFVEADKKEYDNSWAGQLFPDSYSLDEFTFYEFMIKALNYKFTKDEVNNYISTNADYCNLHSDSLYSALLEIDRHVNELIPIIHDEFVVDPDWYPMPREEAHSIARKIYGLHSDTIILNARNIEELKYWEKKQDPYFEDSSWRVIENLYHDLLVSYVHSYPYKD